MGEVQTQQRSLVKTSYFVSPEYVSNVLCYWIGNDENYHREEKWGLDANDGFDLWFGENTLDGKLMGMDGVYCEIVNQRVFDESRKGEETEYKEETKDKFSRWEWLEAFIKQNKVKPFTFDEPYWRAARVKAMPAEKELPSELLEVFERFGYEEHELEDKVVRVVVKRGFKHKHYSLDLDSIAW